VHHACITTPAFGGSPRFSERPTTTRSMRNSAASPAREERIPLTDRLTESPANAGFSHSGSGAVHHRCITRLGLHELIATRASARSAWLRGRAPPAVLGVSRPICDCHRETGFALACESPATRRRNQDSSRLRSAPARIVAPISAVATPPAITTWPGENTPTHSAATA
jgi:hypothetical protein